MEKSKKLSGLLINIFIFDILLDFWKSKKIVIYKKNKETAMGTIELEKAQVKWVLSVKNLNKK